MAVTGVNMWWYDTSNCFGFFPPLGLTASQDWEHTNTPASSRHKDLCPLWILQRLLTSETIHMSRHCPRCFFLCRTRLHFLYCTNLIWEVCCWFIEVTGHRWVVIWIFEQQNTLIEHTPGELQSHSSRQHHSVFVCNQTDCVHWLSTGCPHVLWLYTYPLTFHWLSIDYPLTVHWLSSDCPLNVHRMSNEENFKDCPLTIHWLSSDCPLIVTRMSNEEDFFHKNTIPGKTSFDCSMTVHLLSTDCPLWRVRSIEISAGLPAKVEKHNCQISLYQ